MRSLATMNSTGFWGIKMSFSRMDAGSFRLPTEIILPSILPSFRSYSISTSLLAGFSVRAGNRPSRDSPLHRDLDQLLHS